MAAAPAAGSATATSPVPPTIADKYEIHSEELGRGTWSVVKKVSVIPPYAPPQCPPGTSFVAKIMDKAHLASMSGGDAVRATGEVHRELEVLRHIPPHHNIVPFIEFFETENHFFLIFEEAPSGDLCELILSLAQKRGQVEEETAKSYLYQLIQAVLHCHKHDVVHRDIKPENLLVGANNEIRLTDFGLAKISKSSAAATAAMKEDPHDPTLVAHPFSQLTKKYCQCTDVIGTHRYGAPETFHAKLTHKTYDGFLADTWAVGIVAYIILTGSFPFSAGASASDKEMYRVIMETPLTFPSKVQPLAQSLIRSLLSKDVDKRLRLSEAADHPWFESITRKLKPAESPAVEKIKKEIALPNKEMFTRAEVEKMLSMFSEEAAANAKGIQLLRTEVIQTRINAEAAAAAGAKEQKRTPSVRSGAAPSTGRPGTPASSARAGTPSHRPATPSHRTSTPTAGARSSTPIGSSRVAGSGRTSVATPARRPLQSPAPSPSRPVSNISSTAPSGSVRAKSPTIGHKGSSSNSSTTVPKRSTTPTLSKSAAHSTPLASPLARSNPGAIRRGTPVQPRTGTPTQHRTGTPTRTSAPRVSAASPKVSILSGSATAGSGTSAGTGTGLVSPANSMHRDFAAGDHVTYHGQRAVVHFNGTTGFGPGVWLGIEMLEGTAGINDGTSNVDKHRYFSCPKGKGLFVRPQQVTKQA